MRALSLGLILASLFAAPSAQASMDLAKAKNCLLCHSIDAKVIGPAFRKVAEKYLGQKEVEDKLVKKVREGGGGVWGMYGMPANGQVNDAEARTLVKWVLDQK